MAADVVGYTALMAADEARTLADLRALRAKLFEPITERHGGNVFKRMGDGWLVEFASIVAAAQAALAVQQGLATHATIKLRMGIHIGDVVHEGEDIFGDGVNVASRLQEFAAPGGIALSETAYNFLDQKTAACFADAGRHALNHVAAPVRVFQSGADHGEEKREDKAPELALPDKPSIAVLPFDNMSQDPEQEHFADGIAEDIITALSRFQWFFVIARNSSFSYKGNSPDVRQVARELGVQYILEGSVRKAGNRVRVTAQLVDGLTGRHI